MQHNAKYNDIIQKIESLPTVHQRSGTLRAVESTAIALQRFDFWPDLQKKSQQTIIVAGTNGKGSVCATLEALLLSAGKKVGLFTSPHIFEHTERIRVLGQNISKELFCDAYLNVTQKTSDLNLTHFETLTLMAVWIFFSNQIFNNLDYTIFEVGLGGLYDATNAIPHSTSVITQLGLDHEKILGSTLLEIAKNKFGIVHQHNLVVHAPLAAELSELKKSVQEKTRSTWVESLSYRLLVNVQEETPQFSIETEFGLSKLALPGNRGAQNAALALTVFKALGQDPKLHLNALNKINWPVRMQKDPYHKRLYYSGDHNPQGIESLIDLLQYYPRRHLHMIVGIGSEKNLEKMLNPLFSLKNTSIYITTPSFKPRSKCDFAKWEGKFIDFFPHANKALSYVLEQAHPRDLIVVTGSLYLFQDFKLDL